MTASRSAPAGQPDRVDEPAAPLVAAVGAGQDQARRRRPRPPGAPSRAPPGARRTAPRPRGAVGEHLVEALELGDAERRLESVSR